MLREFRVPILTVSLRAPALERFLKRPRGFAVDNLDRHSMRPGLFCSVVEVYDTVAILGLWSQSIGNYRVACRAVITSNMWPGVAVWLAVSRQMLPRF